MVAFILRNQAEKSHAWADLEFHFQVLRRKLCCIKHVRGKRFRRSQLIVDRCITDTARALLHRRGWKVPEEEAKDVVQLWHIEMLSGGFERFDGRPIFVLAHVILRRIVNKRVRLYLKATADICEAEDAVSATKSPLTALLRNESALAVRAAVNSLPSIYRDVVIVRFYMDRKPAQIATLLGLSVNGVHSRLHRAREMLRGILGDDFQIE